MEDHFWSTCYISVSSYYLQVEEFFRIKVANKRGYSDDTASDPKQKT